MAVYDNIATTPFDFWGQPVITASDGTLFCPGFTGNTISTSVWDKVFIQSAPTPGVCEVRVNKFRDIDKKKAAGNDGARITVHGIEPAMVEIQILIWTPDQLKALNELWPLIFPKSNKRPPDVPSTSPWPPAFDVAHPMLNTHNVKSLIFVRGEGPSPGPIPRTRVFNISAVEFLLPGKKSVTSTPVAPLASKFDPKINPPPGNDSRNTGPT